MSRDQGPVGGVSIDELIEWLTPSLGREKSSEAIRAATVQIEAAGRAAIPATILSQLCAEPGLVGAAARFANVRLDRLKRGSASAAPLPGQRSPAAADDGQTETARLVRAGGAAPGEKRVAVLEIVGLLEPSLGKEKALQTVTETMTAMGLSGVEPTIQQAVDLLEKLSQVGGLLSVAARFATARILVRARA